MDEAPPTKLVLIIALVVILAIGWTIWREQPEQPSMGLTSRLIAYRAITPPVSFNGGTLGVYIWEKAVESGVDPYEAMAVVKCESNFNPYAENTNTNGTKDVGIFQINDVHGISEELRQDPYWSTEWAMEKWKINPNIWVCYNKL